MVASVFLRSISMALDSNTAPTTPQNTTLYEHVLPSIGLGLEALGVHTFDLKVDGNKYIVEGESEARKPETVNLPCASRNAWNIWSKLKRQLSPRIPPKKSPFVFLGMQFTPDDIERMERQGRALESLWEDVPDFRRVSQILRTVGTYVDQKSGRLLRVSKHPQTVSLCYTDFSGSEHTEEFTHANLYDFWVNTYLRKRNSPETGHSITPHD